MLAGAGHTKWKSPSRLEGMTSPNEGFGGRVTLATMATAASDAFRMRVAQGEHLLLVADEVHQIGSLENSRILGLNTGLRLGLSATPERYGDPDGTHRVLSYFEGIIPPPITLMDAVRAGRLVPYEYFPHPVRLSAEEAETWREVSHEVTLEVAKQKTDSSGKKPLTERAKMLLIKRARIAKKAHAKVDLARKILRENFNAGEHWLVYCEDADQLGAVLVALRADGLSPTEYHSSMTGDRDATMAWFRTFGGILVSIRCLDEGVDIPSVSHALILASSQNPRQFIQRRGRVLRTAPGKTIAVVHDAIVVPIHVDDEPEQAALLQSEMSRAIEFAHTAINKMAAAELRAIAAELGLDTSALEFVGVEEEDNG